MSDIQLELEGQEEQDTKSSGPLTDIAKKPEVISSFPPTDTGYILAFSGGKDSLVCAQLCYQRQLETGCTLQAFFMELVPDMDYTSFWIDYAYKRWKIETHRMLHWQTYGLLRDGVFRPQPDPSVRRFKIVHIERRIRWKTGLHWICYGFKKIDSLQRRGMMNRWPNGISEPRGCFAPLHSHNDKQIVHYLHSHHIPVPQSVRGTKVGGIDLTPFSLAYLRKNWPRDYKKVLEIFPQAEGQYLRAAYKPKRFNIPDGAI